MTDEERFEVTVETVLYFSLYDAWTWFIHAPLILSIPAGLVAVAVLMWLGLWSLGLFGFLASFTRFD